MAFPVLINARQAMSAFFPSYYLQHYPDVAQAVANSEVGAAQHYANNGINEFRSPNPYFEPATYRTYPDLNQFTGPHLLQHWMDNGIHELRRGSEHFDLGFYFNNNPDLQAAFGPDAENLFQHWINFGNAEGRLTADGNRILRIGWRQDDTTNLVAAVGPESNDPDLFKPFNTTGGKIGFGIGLVIGTLEGAPVEGAEIGTFIGFGLDRAITTIANEITGPAWKDLEQGPIGQLLGHVLSVTSGGIFPDINVPTINLPPPPKFPPDFPFRF